jgi:hypothetical protein
MSAEREAKARAALVAAIREVKRAERNRDRALVKAWDAGLQAPELAELLGSKFKSRWTVYRRVEDARARVAA